MDDVPFPHHRQHPAIERLEGKHVLARRVDARRDCDDLYELTHGREEEEAVWHYMTYGPFASKAEMFDWLSRLAERSDPLFFTIFSKGHQRSVGMYAIMNISTEHGRAELGNIWYARLAQKTIVNTEATFLFLSYVFDDLRYRRVEWKCDNRNDASKYAALRLGFAYEGLSRQHMANMATNIFHRLW